MEVNFSWFTDGSYLKDHNDKYCAGYTISTPLDVTETAPLPLDTMVQQAKLYALTNLHPSQEQNCQHLYW